MSTSVLKALPGKLDIKRHAPSILYISGPFLGHMHPSYVCFQLRNIRMYQCLLVKQKKLYSSVPSFKVHRLTIIQLNWHVMRRSMDDMLKF